VLAIMAAIQLHAHPAGIAVVLTWACGGCELLINERIAED